MADKIFKLINNKSFVINSNVLYALYEFNIIKNIEILIFFILFLNSLQ